MKNYEYIIASLPEISQNWKFGEGFSFRTYSEKIRELGDKNDKVLIDKLLSGFSDENLNEDFYKSMLSEGDRFLKEYFTFDLNVRNAKARFLNNAFGRPAGQDTIKLETGEFAEADALGAVLQEKDILQRERALDDLMWNKISRITTFNYFDIDAILGFLAKLHIIARWAELDEAAGRERFRDLVDEVKGTFELKTTI